MQKDKNGNEFSDSVFWCSSKLAMREYATFPTKYSKDASCLALLKATGNFEVKNCAEKLHFFCEVLSESPIKLNLSQIVFSKYNCKEVSCPRRSECLKRVFFSLNEKFKLLIFCRQEKFEKIGKTDWMVIPGNLSFNFW